MMKPEPSDVTCWGALLLGPRKFLNRSSSGEPGGRLGMSCGGGAFRVWEVAIFTTLGSSRAERSAKESGAPRAKAGAAKPTRTKRANARRRIKGVPMLWIRQRQDSFPIMPQTGEIGPWRLNNRAGSFAGRRL